MSAKLTFPIFIKRKSNLTHNVISFQCTKPDNYLFIPGQATEISLNINDENKNPFTIASIPSWPYLEFIIKIYEDRHGITEKMKHTKIGQSLFISEPFGTISYQDKGVFIAGGTGITPFIAILRQLKEEKKLHNHTLLFSNKTKIDIIAKEELDAMKNEGLKIIHTLTREDNPRYEKGRINESFLKKHIKDFSQYFYLCGPITFVGELHYIIKKLNADSDKIVVET